MEFVERAKLFFEDWAPALLIGGILLIPTLIHFSMKAGGLIPPFWISAIAIKSVVAGIIAIAIGVGVGLFLNRKFPTD